MIPPPDLFAPRLDNSVNQSEEVSSPADFIQTHYAGESLIDTARVVRIAPFRRNVFITLHSAQVADFEEFRWIVQHGDTEVWYEKPRRSFLRQMATLESSGCEPEPLPALENARPVSLETPRVWASAALTTPIDDDIYDCSAGHANEEDFSGACPQCTDEKSEALDATPLVYYVVLSTCQASDPFIHGAHFNGRQIYKLVKCGSREAAAAEAFYSSGINGWSVAFSCAMRGGETFEERPGKAKRVEDLWMLADDEEEEDVVRVFY